MLLSVYVTLGVFLPLAARNPAANRSLIAWSSSAHAVPMSLLAIPMVSERVGFLAGSDVLVVIAEALVGVAPAKPSAQLAPAASAQAGRNERPRR
jgi:uncharacterized protein DUF6632